MENLNIIPKKMSNTKLKLSDLNPHLMCVLCGGYYIDATTIVECLHSFCRSCIVKHLESSKYCPICEVQVHKTKPLINIRPDKTLQDIVYKLVPGLFSSEMKNRRLFYKERPHYIKPSDSESAGEIFGERKIYVNDENITFSLVYFVGFRASNFDECFREMKPPLPNEIRYFKCPTGVSIYHLKKLIRAKYGLNENNFKVEIYFGDQALYEDFTLLDVSYMYLWKSVKKETLNLTFKIFQNVVKRKRISKEEDQNLKKAQKDNEKIEDTSLTVTVPRKKIKKTPTIRKLEVKEEKTERTAQSKVTGETKVDNAKVDKEKVDKNPNLEINITKENGTGSEVKEVQLQISESGVMSVSQVEDGELVRTVEETAASVTNKEVTTGLSVNKRVKEKEEVSNEPESVKRLKTQSNSSPQSQSQSRSPTQYKSQARFQPQMKPQTKPQIHVQPLSISPSRFSSSSPLQQQSQPKPQSPSHVQSESSPQSKSQSQHRFQSQFHSQSQQPESQALPQIQSPTQNHSKSQSEQQHHSQYQPQSQKIKPQPQSPTQSQHKSQSQVQNQSQPKTLPQSSSQSKSEAQSQSQSEVEPQPQSESQIQAKSQQQSLLDSQNQGQFQSPPQSHLESQSQIQSSSKSPSKFFPPLLPDKKVRPGKLYKTIHCSPKVWHPVIPKEKLRPTLMKNSDEPKKPPKFFKMRNMPRFLGNPSSGVKPMYAENNVEEKSIPEETKNETSKSLNKILKIDPKTLRPIEKDEIKMTPNTPNLLTNPFIPNNNHFLFSDLHLLPPNSGNYSNSGSQDNHKGEKSNVTGYKPPTPNGSYPPICFPTPDPPPGFYPFSNLTKPPNFPYSVGDKMDPLLRASRLSPFGNIPGFNMAGFHASLPPSISRLLNPQHHYRKVNQSLEKKNKEESTKDSSKNCDDSLKVNKKDEKEEKKSEKSEKKEDKELTDKTECKESDKEEKVESKQLENPKEDKKEKEVNGESVGTPSETDTKTNSNTEGFKDDLEKEKKTESEKEEEKDKDKDKDR